MYVPYEIKKADLLSQYFVCPKCKWVGPGSDTNPKPQELIRCPLCSEPVEKFVKPAKIDPTPPLLMELWRDTPTFNPMTFICPTCKWKGKGDKTAAKLGSVALCPMCDTQLGLNLLESLKIEDQKDSVQVLVPSPASAGPDMP